MNDLSSKIINSKWVSEIEEHLRSDLQDVELIGELDITENAFQHICKVLQDQCRFKNNIQPKYLYPAVFVVSMVFSGRYSHDETRKFWEPYAEDVWGIDYSQYRNQFYRACRDYYAEAKAELEGSFGFEFPAQNQGDVVRTVYWHTILPSYLHDDFARWLSARLKHISKLPEGYLSKFIRSPHETQYIAPTLQAFLVEEETHEIAVELISDFIAATDLLANHVDVIEIRELFPSLIHRELWDKFVAELERETLVAKTPERNTRIEWVWSFEYEDWVLRVLNLTADAEKQPALYVWSSRSENEAIWENYYQEDLWAEQQSNRKWRIREILLGTLDKEEMLKAFIYVYDQAGNCIWAEDVPDLPDSGFQFYRVTQQGKYAVPEELHQISSGEWLVSHNNDFSIYDELGHSIAPQSSEYYVSYVMENIVGHSTVEMYDLSLPIEIQIADIQYKIEKTKRRHIPQPQLSQFGLVDDTSDRLPPVYTTNKIRVSFSEIKIATKYLKIHITTPTEHIYEQFDKYAEPNADGYDIDLSQFIPDDQIGTYELDITYGFRSRLAAPIEFSVVPNLTFSDMPSEVFSPLNPPSIVVNNLTTEVLELSKGQGEIEYINDNSARIIWTDLKYSFCRVQVRDGNIFVPVEWKIERFYAWIENSTIPNRLIPEDLERARIHFRGIPNRKLALFVDEAYFGVDLSAKGEETFDLFVDRFRDVLQQVSKASVPLKIRFDDEFWTFAFFVRAPQIVKSQIDYVSEDNQEWILLDVELSHDLDAKFELEIRHLDENRTIQRNIIEDIQQVVLIPAKLLPGHYELHLFANGESIQSAHRLIAHVPTPSVSDFEIDYNRNTSELYIRYDVDNIRAGSYVLRLIGAQGNTVLNTPLSIEEKSYKTRVQLLPGISYEFVLLWQDKIIGQHQKFIVEEDALTTSQQGAPISKQSPQTVDTLTEIPTKGASWIQKLISTSSDDRLTKEELLKLSTVSSTEINGFTTNDLAKLWRPLGRLSEVQDVTKWSVKYGMLPTWTLLDNILAMVTNEGTSYLVYPELLLEGGLTGIGKIALETPQEGKFYGYARWSKRTQHASRLHVWIPPKDPQNDPYASLDELDMRPAYYDRLSGNFHGSRTKYMMPGLNIKDRTFLVDVAHTYTLLVSIRQTHLQLYHKYWSRASIDRSFTQAILQKRVEDVEGLSISRAIITKPSGYRYATTEWVNNYFEDKASKPILKRFVSDDTVGGKLANFAANIPRLAQIANMPLLFGATRFIEGMEKQVQTEGEHRLMRLDKNILSLAIILRIKSMRQDSVTRRILNQANFSDQELAQAVHDANIVCPTLLEWALTWAEILSIHSAYQ